MFIRAIRGLFFLPHSIALSRAGLFGPLHSPSRHAAEKKLLNLFVRDTLRICEQMTDVARDDDAFISRRASARLGPADRLDFEPFSQAKRSAGPSPAAYKEKSFTVAAVNPRQPLFSELCMPAQIISAD